MTDMYTKLYFSAIVILLGHFTAGEACHTDEYSDNVWICSNLNLSFAPDVNQSVEVLDLSNNNILYIANDTFPEYSSLHTLDLSHNRIRTVLYDAFFGLYDLREVNLSANDLTYISPLTFVRNTKLESLTLRDNPLISRYIFGSILKSYSLQTLDLSFCGLTNLSSNNFADLYNLSSLYLSYNASSEPSITDIESFYELQSFSDNKCDLQVTWTSGTGSISQCWRRLESRKIYVQQEINDNGSIELDGKNGSNITVVLSISFVIAFGFGLLAWFVFADKLSSRQKVRNLKLKIGSVLVYEEIMPAYKQQLSF